MITLAECSHQDVLRVVLQDGTVIDGSYIPQAGMHFLLVRDGSLMGKVEGPLDPEMIVGLERLTTKSEVTAARLARLRGVPFPGRAPVSRDDFEYRLQLLARAVAAEADSQRLEELRYQFNDVADMIQLAAPKRAWILAEGRFTLTSNEPPTMRDLWLADVASPSLFRRPRPQDFDPDPSRRRKQTPLPADIIAEPRSVPNTLGTLRAAGFKAAISLAGDPAYDRADIQVDLASGRLHRFIAEGRRKAGTTCWRLRWAGNDSAAGRRRRRMLLKTEAYLRLVSLLALPPAPNSASF